MVKQRISYIDPTNIADVEMRNEFERCRTRGTPRPESQAIRACTFNILVIRKDMADCIS